jgi:hypothetical protein
MELCSWRLDLDITRKRGAGHRHPFPQQYFNANLHHSLVIQPSQTFLALAVLEASLFNEKEQVMVLGWHPACIPYMVLHSASSMGPRWKVSTKKRKFKAPHINDFVYLDSSVHLSAEEVIAVCSGRRRFEIKWD